MKRTTLQSMCLFFPSETSNQCVLSCNHQYGHRKGHGSTDEEASRSLHESSIQGRVYSPYFVPGLLGIQILYPNRPVTLLSMPNEILANIFDKAGVNACASLTLTCKTLARNYLFTSFPTLIFDMPSTSVISGLPCVS